jgi:nucleoside-diphosphate-sugar epimerase
MVTGASGFIGRAACTELLKRGFRVRAAVRDNASTVVSGAERYTIGDLRHASEWKLDGVDAVIHLAGIAHELRGQNAEAVYQAVNCAATERLAREAAKAGVRRLVFASSIKVNGERTAPDRPFREDDAPQPADRYARSKWAAERALAAIAAGSRLEVVIVRPPLVYGPGVRANFRRLIDLVKSGVPLPLASIRNRRSLVYVGNLADVLALAVSAPAAKGRTLLVSDGEDLSTPELVRRLGAALGRMPRLFPFPTRLLPAKLVESLVVDSSATRSALAWKPRHGVDAGLAETVR